LVEASDFIGRQTVNGRELFELQTSDQITIFGMNRNDGGDQKEQPSNILGKTAFLHISDFSKPMTQIYVILPNSKVEL
jgi:hypothetical protein